MDFAVPANDRVKIKESEKSDKYLDLARKLKKAIDYEGDCILIVICALGTIPKRLVKWVEVLEIRGRAETIQTTYSIIKIGQNTKKSSGDLRILAVTQTPVKDHQLMLMWKIFIIIIILKAHNQTLQTKNYFVKIIKIG